MNKEDYFEYYIQGSDHYLIPKDVFDELMYEFDNWRNQSYRYEDKINKAIEYIEWQEKNPQYDNVWRSLECEGLIEILKGDSNE